MKIHPTQLHTLELTCKRCKETKYAKDFKKYSNPLRVYDLCMSCVNERSRIQRKKCDGTIKSREFLSMYHAEGTEPKLSYHERQWRYKKFCAKRLELQTEMELLEKAGFNLTRRGECDRIDAYLKGIRHEGH